ncbi:hypothetical protein BDW75DRAFT_244026 [Aspergillus navahoensis]
MPLQRDSKTGKVIVARVDPRNNNYTNDPVYGKIRRAFRDLLDGEWKAERRNNAQNTARSVPAGPAPEYRLQDSLLVVEEEVEAKEEDGDGRGQPHCPNARERIGMWVGTRRMQSLEPIAPPHWPLLNRLAHLCRAAGIRHCAKAACLKNREAVQRASPPLSQWRAFWDWAVTVVCCEVSCSEADKLRRPFFHLAAAANSCHWLLVEYKDGRRDCSNLLFGPDSKEAEVDLFSVCEMIYWLVTVQSSLGRNDVLEGRWGPDFLAPSITEGPIVRAAAEARTAGICEDRLWNLALVSDRKQVDLPCLMEAVTNNAKLRHHPGHERCTVGYCRTATVDSTKVKQLHRPAGTHDCQMLHFDPALLAKSIKTGGGRTCWTITEPYEVAQHQPYIAISHVWSDGTGIGIQSPGKVNSCLFEYMSGVVKRLNCNAIWWDTISIPTDEVARKKAINDMHLNYRSAEYTVLHDNYLLNHEWADDGSPCVAIVFSPWLTRGWTALELIMSRKVKVLFKGPNKKEPLIKDLDDEILAKDPARCTRAHWIASTILRRLRRPIDNVTDLMAVLKPRHTSWARDRMIIAGLLSGLEFENYNIPQDNITKAILDRVERINACSLLHGKDTISQDGGWSWCPPSLYDMPADTVADLFERGTIGDRTCVVDKDGVLAGAWHYRPLQETEVTEGRITPNSTQLSLTTRIHAALRRWRYCLLLRESSSNTKGPAILVIPQGRDRDFIHCKFIGSVHVFEPSSSQPARGDTERDPYDLDFFKIGSENKDMLAKKFLKAQPRHPDEDYQWLHHKLWISDTPFVGGLLVTRSKPKRGLTRGYFLGVEESNKLKATRERVLSDLYPDKHIFPCLAEVTLRENSVFRVWSGTQSQKTTLRRLTDAKLWPPETIPALERTAITGQDSRDYLRGHSENLFYLRDLPSGSATFAALLPAVYTPDLNRPYRGVWMGFYPGHGYEFLLFHQPTDNLLEGIKLTGDRNVPRGAVSLIVGDIGQVKSDDKARREDGTPMPVVDAKVLVANDGFTDRMYIDVELHLMSQDDILIVTKETLIQLVRVDLGPLLSMEGSSRKWPKGK